MSETTLQAYYAARALEYDEVYLKPERQADLRAIERWLLSRFIDAHVLEVACGTGYWTQFIAPLASAITAIDATAETLKIAEQRVRNNDVHFEVGDAYALPHVEGGFDGAFAGFLVFSCTEGKTSGIFIWFARALEARCTGDPAR
ncbi:MAG: class I SAM-dependent methyltransferase [Herminiimonas sp.]|uniref:class I SAM-dependent methyltransferase n=1 Tax=Herminiimonas sp. TaxID=1926289 RepID=UPI002715B1C7|nr:class I SAM-dependent methyltransferase [Herminiimonas sp.]MDO9422230.1 class I SAM-dependent methyltransferase [Herminiimonas sp.]